MGGRLEARAGESSAQRPPCRLSSLIQRAGSVAENDRFWPLLRNGWPLSRYEMASSGQISGTDRMGKLGRLGRRLPDKVLEQQIRHAVSRLLRQTVSKRVIQRGHASC